MRRLYLAVIYILITIPFLKCQKELSFDKGSSFFESGPKSFQGVLQGNVIDENNQPATGVAIAIGNKTAITDVYGYFRIRDAALEKEASVVTAEKAGYFKSYRTFNATPGANQVKIKLIKKELAGKINSTAGGEVKLANGSLIALSANGVVQAGNGNDYSGEVNVYAAYIDPTSADISATVPGSFMANDKDGKRKVLASYGMLAVQLESAAGEKLQIKPGVTATLTTSIPSALQSSAPATIPLWYIDEQTGIWQEEGSAVKKGNVYVGGVTHFSFWNYDVPFDAVNLSFTLKTNTGSPLAYTLVKITAKSNNGDSVSSAYGTTDSLGQVSGLVPSDKFLVLEVKDYECNNLIYSKNIEPLKEDKYLGVISITDVLNALITLKGKLLNCAGNPIKNGYALIRYHDYNYMYIAANSKGDFEVTVIQCAGNSTNYFVLGVDEQMQQQGAMISGTMQGPVIEIGNIIACGTSTSQFISYRLDGVNYQIMDDQPRDSIGGSGTSAYTYDIGNSNFITNIGGSDRERYISFRFTGVAVAGTYAIDTMMISNLQNARIVSPFNVTVTNFPLQPQEFFEGSFSGNLKDAENKIHALSGSFRIRRF